MSSQSDALPTTTEPSTLGFMALASAEPIGASTRSRAWMWTLNTPTIQAEAMIRGLQPSQLIRYLTFGQEVGGKTGRMHLQGYIEVHRPQSQLQICRLLGGHVWCAPRYKDSTAKACIKYVTQSLCPLTLY